MSVKYPVMDDTERNPDASKPGHLSDDAVGKKGSEAEGSSEPNGFGERPREFGGRKGPDPVRYGDWEKNGRCIDF